MGELSKLEERQAMMEEEMDTKYNKIKEVENNAHDEKRQLVQDKKELTDRQDSLKIELKQSEFAYEKAKQKFQRHKLYADMKKQEKIVANNGKAIYNFKSYIQGKSKDMNYKDSQMKCLDMLD